MEKQPTVIADKDQGPEIIASAIEEVSRAAKKLLASRLSRRAIVVLIRDMHPSLTLQNIELVLTSAAELEKRYVKS